jgi:lysophospholipase L1-like esterase
MPRSILLSLALLSLVSGYAADPASAEPARVDASSAIARTDERFTARHAAFLKRAQEGPIGLLFLGDSITANWSKAPEVWKEYYEKHQAANFGIGSDKTENVIWRIENGELDGIAPRVVVLLIGTNNSGSHKGTEIAAANEKIVRLIRAKLPAAKVLLLGIFPRGPRGKDNPAARMEVIKSANAQLAKLDDGKHVRFLDIGAKLCDADGKIPAEIMPDQLHLSVEGYKIWAVAMQPLLDEMLR